MILKELVGLMDIGCKVLRTYYEGLTICELGDQRMKWHPDKTGKKYLLNLGVKEHISLDWNKKNGALKRDLSKPVDEWQSYFDMVTNFGTTEHINNGQYDVFKNIHNFVKVGGVMVHALPLVGHWKRHCKYHYEEDFPETLSTINGYECVLSEIRVIKGRAGQNQPMVCAVLKKTSDKEFASEEEFKNMNKIAGLK